MHRKALLLLFFILIFNVSLLAQYDDPGIPDTVRVDSIQIDPGPAPVVFSVEVTAFTDEYISAASLGFYYDSDDIDIDSITLDGGAAEDQEDQSQVKPDSNLAIIGFYWSGIGSPMVPGDSLIANFWFTLDANAPDQTINIDSGFFPPAGDFILTPLSGISLKPQFKAGKIVVGAGTPPQPEIDLNPTSFTFNGTVGGANPNPQVLNIVNIGDGSLNWSATWNSSWLTVSPSNGTAPSNPAVSVNIFGLTAGTYEDTITISDPNAVNSPQYVPVTLELINPPPEIELVPENFYFIAVQDDVNPSDQQMTINDIGGGTLSWTASNSSAWLTLSSYSGGPGETIDLMVDITGLTYGFYYDTIVVSDPAASNSPQEAEVVLELVSSFPVLSVSPEDSFVVAGSPAVDPYDRVLKVINSGGGTMNYELSANKPWISFSPQSGSTSDTAEVLVTFHSTGLPLGYQYADITVSSDNASESPQEIDVLLWVLNNPPELGVSTNNLSFSGYTCQNIPPIPDQTFEITNPNLEDLLWTASWDADWLSLSPTSGPNSQTVNVFVDEVGLPAGNYVDTIQIDARWSTTPSQYIEVSFSLLENPAPPELTVDTNYVEYIFMAGDVGVAIGGELQIGNAISGCIDWYISDPYPWLLFDKLSGDTPDSVTTAVNGGGLPLGITSGQFSVVAPGSVNDSIIIPFDVYIAQLGDANCDGKINISDAVHIINYVFIGGPQPIPRIWAGDVNCDYTSNVEDAVKIIAIVFGFGEPICQYQPIINPPVVFTADEAK
jgi:hypothetical protein